MKITEVLVEGKSAAEYLAAAIRWYDAALLPFLGKIKDGGGYSDIEERLRKAQSQGSDKSLFIVWDGDVLSRKGKLPIQAVIDHRPAYSFQRDFEATFPDWMLAEALAVFDPQAQYPQETDLRRFQTTEARYESGYERLAAVIRAHAVAKGRDPTSVVPPGKVQLADCLARVAERTHYQPEEIRRLFDLLIASADSSQNACRAAMGTEFTINREVIQDWGLSGRIAFYVLNQVMLLDLAQMTISMVADEGAAGPPCWSPDGKALAFPSVAPSGVPNSDAVRVVDMQSMNVQEFYRIGHYLCWDKSGRLIGNTYTADGYVVTRLDPSTKDKDRSRLNLPPRAIVACVDRGRDRILVGDQERYEGHYGGVPCGMFRLNDGERVWDSLAAHLPLAEYSAPALSPDGALVSWPLKEGSRAGASLWVSSFGKKLMDRRMTGQEGSVQTSTWSPDGKYVAFMWYRWFGDPVRMWVAKVSTLDLMPLLDGPFGDSGLTGLGCHSWAGTPAP